MNVLLRLLLLVFLSLSSQVRAIDDSDLFPIDDAFQVSATALDE